MFFHSAMLHLVLAFWEYQQDKRIYTFLPWEERIYGTFLFLTNSSLEKSADSRRGKDLTHKVFWADRMCWVFYLLPKASANLDLLAQGTRLAMGLKKRPGPGWTDDDKRPSLRMCRSRRSTWLQGTLRMGIPGTGHHHIMPRSWKVAPSFGNSLQACALPAFCCGSQPIPWPWLCSQALSSSATSQPHPTAGSSPCPPFTPVLLGCIHFTIPKCLCLLFASALSRFLSPGHVALFFLPPLVIWQVSTMRATGVFPGGSCAWGSAGESKAQTWETWRHQQWANATLLFSIFKIGYPRAAEQQACSTLTLFHQNKFISIEINLRESLQAQEGKCHVCNEKDSTNKRPSTPPRRKVAQLSRVQDQGSGSLQSHCHLFYLWFVPLFLLPPQLQMAMLSDTSARRQRVLCSYI